MTQRVTLPYTIDFVFRHGADFQFVHELKNADGSDKSTVGYAFEMSVRPKPGETEIAHFSSGNEDFTLSGATGVVTLVVPASLILTLTPGTYHYDILRTDADGKLQHVFAGGVTVQQMNTEASSS